MERTERTRARERSAAHPSASDGLRSRLWAAEGSLGYICVRKPRTAHTQRTHAPRTGRADGSRRPDPTRPEPAKMASTASLTDSNTRSSACASSCWYLASRRELRPIRSDPHARKYAQGCVLGIRRVRAPATDRACSAGRRWALGADGPNPNEPFHPPRTAERAVAAAHVVRCVLQLQLRRGRRQLPDGLQRGVPSLGSAHAAKRTRSAIKRESLGAREWNGYDANAA